MVFYLILLALPILTIGYVSLIGFYEYGLIIKEFEQIDKPIIMEKYYLLLFNYIHVKDDIKR